MRIIHKTGPLHNPADRDHCLEYMTAIGLLFGQLTADHYEDTIAADPRIDSLRQMMVVRENPGYTLDYLDPEKRSIANAIQVFFLDGTNTARVEVEYPVGHRRRRAEGIPLLLQKFRRALASLFKTEADSEIERMLENRERFRDLRVSELMDLFSRN
jgi:2-methylcitrate dehydratase PrpD